MKKKFLTGVGLILALNFIIKPIWVLGIDRTVQNVVGPSEYGFYFAIFNFSLIFNMILDFGITNFNQRTISQSPQIIRKLISRVLPLKLILSLLYAVVIFIIAFAVGYDSRQFYFLAFLGINQVLASYVLYMRSNITGMMMFKTDSIMSIMDKTLMILFCSVLLWGGVAPQPFKIEWFVYAQTAAYLVAAIVVSIVVFTKTKLQRFSWNRKFLFSLVRQAFPYALLSLLMSFHYRIDPFLIERILPECGDYQAGIYAAAYRILDVFATASYMVSFFLLPMFARYIKQKENMHDIIRLAFSLLITISVIASVTCAFYAYDLMDLLYKNDARQSADVFRILIWGFIAISSSYVFGTLLTANGNLKQLNIVAAIGIVVNLSINFLLIPRLMAVGSAWASLATQFATAIIQVFLAYRVFKLKVDVKQWIRIGLFIFGTILISAATKFIPLHPLVNFLIAVAIALLLAFVLKIVTPGYLMRMLKEKE